MFGTDLPVEGGKGGEFAWRDGPFLVALKAGHWIVLDEVGSDISYDLEPLLWTIYTCILALLMDLWSLKLIPFFLTLKAELGISVGVGGSERLL